jgi:hypothetical protein
MTTNRILTIDIAVQSRIHYAIRFGRLDKEQTKAVWETFQDQLNDTNSDSDERKAIRRWLENNLNDLVESGFSGREIRNLFTTAQLLAFKRDNKVSLKDITTVVKSTSVFRSDLQKYRDQAEAETSAGIRAGQLW